MTRTNGLYQWQRRVTRQFPELTTAQAGVLALYSFGMVLAQASGLSGIALALGVMLNRSANTVRQQLRELYQPANVKSGRQRCELDVTLCFAPLLRWIIGGWTDKRLVLALDPTNIGQRFTVLAVSVVYQGCAIPVAWQVRGGTQKGQWNDAWKDLLFQVKQGLSADWNVLVLSDRGLESRELFATIVACGWHPLMRVKAQGTFRPEGWYRYYPMALFAAKLGQRWRGRGVAYQNRAALPCTLLACWTDGHDEPWLLLTDLAPSAANPAWYAFRAWIERGFKVLKSAGWQWQRSRVTDPDRAARQWAALALATLWLVEVGGEAERLQLPALGHTADSYSLFRIGLFVILAALINRRRLPHGQLATKKWTKAKWKSDPLTETTMRTRKKTYP